jgi:hypothetical protein
MGDAAVDRFGNQVVRAFRFESVDNVAQFNERQASVLSCVKVSECREKSRRVEQ